MSELYRLIHAEKATYPIVLLCRVLHVARSSYYAWREGEAPDVLRVRQGDRVRTPASGHLAVVARSTSQEACQVPLPDEVRAKGDLRGRPGNQRAHAFTPAGG
ncbi:hypothetical protein ABZ357_25905 [Streptomyces sp. NPDC005917]|uniref:hypothetical protein n=1 Tax=unclassified Streptomyces TaxID=2593676 RepID=UPI0033CBE0A9